MEMVKEVEVKSEGRYCWREMSEKGKWYCSGKIEIWGRYHNTTLAEAI